MTYELAKELKDAGFRQTPSSKNKNPLNFRAPGFFLDAGTDTVYIPTLSELIEACGEEFGALSTSRIIQSILPEHQDKLGKIYEWKASRHDPDKRWECGEPSCCPGCGGEGSTPEEAVARLWLAIKNTK